MRKFALLSIAVLALAGCASTKRPAATATMSPTSGSTASGTVRLAALPDGTVEFLVDLTGVPPGVHGFHIHDKGDCGDNGNAAGGHFNPGSAPHGDPAMMPHHAGDFGNVNADAAGVVKARFTSHSITLDDAGATSAIGRAFILHANPDDLKTQPTGNAGARIACGVVTLR